MSKQQKVSLGEEPPAQKGKVFKAKTECCFVCTVHQCYVGGYNTKKKSSRFNFNTSKNKNKMKTEEAFKYFVQVCFSSCSIKF